MAQVECPRLTSVLRQLIGTGGSTLDVDAQYIARKQLVQKRKRESQKEHARGNGVVATKTKLNRAVFGVDEGT